MQQGNQTPFSQAPEVDCLQLREAAAKRLTGAILPACEDTAPQGTLGMGLLPTA